MYALLCSSGPEGGNWLLNGSGYTWFKLNKAKTDYLFSGPDFKFLSEEIQDAQLEGTTYLWPISYNQWSRATRCKHAAKVPEKYGRGDIQLAVDYRDTYWLQGKVIQ